MSWRNATVIAICAALAWVAVVSLIGALTGCPRPDPSDAALPYPDGAAVHPCDVPFLLSIQERRALCIERIP